MTRATRFSAIALYLVLTGAVLSPLLLVSIPPLVDYPNHLARMWILLHCGDIPALAQNYVVHWRLVPYLAMDLIVPPLATIMPLELAGKIFVALTMASLVGGTIVLHRALYGRIGLWPLASLLFIYDAVLFFGFMNCLFGMGMFLFAFSGWIATENWRPLLRISMFAAVATLLLILHLFAFGIYGVAVATYELGALIEKRGSFASRFRSYCLICFQFVPGFLLWTASLKSGGSSYVHYGNLNDKIYALFAATTFGSAPTRFDLVVWLAGFAFLILGLVGGWLRVAPRMRWPLAALILAAALMPNWVSGSWAADIRLPVILPFLMIGALQVSIPEKRIGLGICGAAALMLLAVRLAAVSAIWQDGDRRFAEFRNASVAIAPGARLFTVMAPMPDAARKLPNIPLFLAERPELALAHIEALAVIDRSAFIPDMFIAWMTVDPAPRNEGLENIVAGIMTPELLNRSADPAESRALSVVPNQLDEMPYWADWPEKFDYVLWVDYGTTPLDVPHILEPVATGSFFHLYRVVRRLSERERVKGSWHDLNPS